MSFIDFYKALEKAIFMMKMPGLIDDEDYEDDEDDQYEEDDEDSDNEINIKED